VLGWVEDDGIWKGKWKVAVQMKCIPMKCNESTE